MVNNLVTLGKKLTNYFLHGSSPLFIICFCGLFGILVDFDHIVTLIWYPEKIDASRFIHTPILIVSGTLFLCLSSLFGGLYLKLVLGKRRKK